MYIKVAVDSSIHVNFRARTDLRTHTQSHRRHWSPYPPISYRRRGKLTFLSTVGVSG